MNVFDFDPDDAAQAYQRFGYVHLKQGLNKAFLDYALNFLHAAEAEAQSLEEWRFKGKKRQYLFDFPDDMDFDRAIRAVVGGVAGLPGERVTLCERHVKVYEGEAPSNPPPHKDRVASQVTVGIPLVVPDDSYLILYPEHYRDVNAYASTALYRTSLDEAQLPETQLAAIEPVKLDVPPGDVLIFKGASMYHERVNPANTSLLYLKFNGIDLDPLGEDPRTLPQRTASLDRLNHLADEQLLSQPMMVSPRLEKISRYYTRLYWTEVIQLNVWGEKEATIGEAELALLTRLDRGLTAADLLTRMGLDDSEFGQFLPKLRRLINLGAIDLIHLD
ncbi:hypothetical protein [Marinobacter sp. SS21]|uniref:hypothetical protein n=1 Tax=Marinobacter sp. SS21 TaxID=2979460 RepID=UPI002330BE8E|nr:hypothetical protein [Marinobacter sp. SS21]MDC0663129.1 hypothetical protein [Marinobacter sp. SS21]